MFERFTAAAREVVVGSQAEARRLGHPWVGTEHLLLAILHQPSALADALSELGLGHDSARDQIVREIGRGDGGRSADADALRDLGIDVDEVRRRVEARFGSGALESARPSRRRRFGRRRRRDCGGHIPFTPRAKRTLELALRESLRLRSGHIAVGHVLLGLLAESEGMAALTVARLGLTPEAVRRAVLDQLGRAA